MTYILFLQRPVRRSVSTGQVEQDRSNGSITRSAALFSLLQASGIRLRSSEKTGRFVVVHRMFRFAARSKTVFLD